jgi:hypothetical protein
LAERGDRLDDATRDEMTDDAAEVESETAKPWPHRSRGEKDATIPYRNPPSITPIPAAHE